MLESRNFASDEETFSYNITSESSIFSSKNILLREVVWNSTWTTLISSLMSRMFLHAKWREGGTAGGFWYLLSLFRS